MDILLWIIIILGILFSVAGSLLLLSVAVEIFVENVIWPRQYRLKQKERIENKTKQEKEEETISELQKLNKGLLLDFSYNCFEKMVNEKLQNNKVKRYNENISQKLLFKESYQVIIKKEEAIELVKNGMINEFLLEKIKVPDFKFEKLYFESNGPFIFGFWVHYKGYILVEFTIGYYTTRPTQLIDWVK